MADEDDLRSSSLFGVQVDSKHWESFSILFLETSTIAEVFFCALGIGAVYRIWKKQALNL